MGVLLSGALGASVPNSKFAYFAASSGANFEFDKDASKLMILVPLCDLKFLRRTCGKRGRNFKSPALVLARRGG